jgi:uncharacterized membrane protein YhhN
MSGTNLVTLLIVVAGTGYLAALAFDRPFWLYLLKPMTMLLIIGLAVIQWHPTSSSDRFLVAGLLLSVVGDIFLMLPSDKFVAGLAAFLGAHLLYIVAFTDALGFGWVDLVIVALLVAVTIPIYRKFVPALVAHGGGLPVAVGLYVIVLAVMVWRAVMTGNPVIAAGAILFLCSDTLLGWNRFVRRIAGAEYGIMSTYFLAQYLLAHSVGSR